MPEFALAKEAIVKAAIDEAEAQRKALDERVTGLQAELASLGGLRALLYESGRPLEEAVLRSLRALGFEADRYKDSGSEFDVVFRSEEGRFLGEIEGKDSKPINIDKLRQLEMNISEDFERDEVKEHAKGVLFGNAFRLVEPAKRGEAFTEKCLAQAKRGGFALFRTPDLFAAVRYVEGSGDAEYATLCRKAIAETAGAVVTFPPVPAK